MSVYCNGSSSANIVFCSLFTAESREGYGFTTGTNIVPYSIIFPLVPVIRTYFVQTLNPYT